MYQNTAYGPMNPNMFPGGGYAYTGRPAPRYTQPVTAELSKMLFQTNDELDIRISNADKIRNWCTHKEPGTGRIALVDNGDGTVTCRTCGATFRTMTNEVITKMAEDGKIRTVEDVARVAQDVLQTIKAMYVDVPEDFIKNYSQIYSMLGKLNDLYNRALKNFSLYEGYTGGIMPSSQNYNYNPFMVANGMLASQWATPFNGGMMPGGMMPGYPGAMPQQPGMPQPGMGQPGMNYGVPMQPGYGYPQQPAQPQPGMMPQQPNMGVSQPVNPFQASANNYPFNGYVQMGPGGVPTVDAQGNIYAPTGMPNGPTTMAGQPVQPGMNPFVDAAAPVNGAVAAPAPVPTPGAAPAAAPSVDGIPVGEPTQNKTMTV